MPKIGNNPKPVCKACRGTGINSRGWPCSPCANRKAMEEFRKTVKQQLIPLDDPKLGERFLNVGKENHA